MQNIRKIFFPRETGKIIKGFGPAFLVIALGIGSGEFILWPFLSAHYGFGILWGALLGITLQWCIIVALEKNTAFLGENILLSFKRIFKYAFGWILFSTIIGFGWPGFSAISSRLLIDGFGLDTGLHTYVSIFILVLATLLLVLGKNMYKRILSLQKINMGFLLLLILFLFIYYFDIYVFLSMLGGFVGRGQGYTFIPAGLSLLTFMGAIAYAGSGGNLLLMNSFYVEEEEKGLVGEKKDISDSITPMESTESIKNAYHFTKRSWKQNGLFFWGTGLLIIMLLSYISYAVLYGNQNMAEDFSFIITEASIFSRDIHPLIGKLFIISGVLALFGVQIGILDFIGRITKTIKKYTYNHHSDLYAYRFGVLITALLGLLVFFLGFSQPYILIIIGSTLNAFSMGVITWLLYRVEMKLIPKYIQSRLLKYILIFGTLFYISFFVYVVVDRFLT